MNKLRTIALFSVLSIFATGCKKNQDIQPDIVTSLKVTESSPYHLYNVFGKGISSSPSADMQEKFIDVNSKSTKVSIQVTGISGLNWLDFLAKGFAFIEQRVNDNTLVQHYYVVTSAKTNDINYWTIMEELPISKKGILTQNPQTDFSYWWENPSFNWSKTYTTVKFVPDAPFEGNKFVDIQVSSKYRVSNDNGNTWSYTTDGAGTWIRIHSDNVDFPSTLPAIVKITDNDFQVYPGINLRYGESITGPGIYYESSNAKAPYAGTYFKPSLAKIGVHKLTKVLGYWNGTSKIERLVTVN